MIYGIYIKIALVVVFICGIFFAGWHMRDRDFTLYKMEQQVAVEKQKAEVESIKKQQEITTKGIQDEYDAKISAVRNYYKSTSVWNNPSGGSMSGISSSPKQADVITAYNQLVESCSETTIQLIELQKWINEQVGIK